MEEDFTEIDKLMGDLAIAHNYEYSLFKKKEKLRDEHYEAEIVTNSLQSKLSELVRAKVRERAEKLL